MADVGVGITGQEGRQAVMASDFSMGQFRFLVPLLFVHGHWNYQRMSYMLLYNFYRNAVFVFVLFWWVWFFGIFLPNCYACETAISLAVKFMDILWWPCFKALPNPRTMSPHSNQSGMGNENSDMILSVGPTINPVVLCSTPAGNATLSLGPWYLCLVSGCRYPGFADESRRALSCVEI